MENEQIKKKKGVITIKLITQFNLSGKWQYNEIPKFTYNYFDQFDDGLCTA